RSPSIRPWPGQVGWFVSTSCQVFFPFALRGLHPAPSTSTTVAAAIMDTFDGTRANETGGSGFEPAGGRVVVDGDAALGDLVSGA
ncbi:hypothetical protein K0U73_03905, partial [bacterium]|nr:hypothetical protein [bacterium]